MKQKIIVLIMTLLIILGSITFPTDLNVKAYAESQTLYVGGSNPGNYTYIQNAIENATSGNTTIYVYNGEYQETIIINKSIDLIGESTDSIITGNGNECAIIIETDNVNISNFTIQNGGGEEEQAGIKITGNHTNISKNIIKNCDAMGIYLENGCNNTIYNNQFTNIINTSTIFLWKNSAYNTISKNNITNCGCAIDIGNGSHHNNISENIINNNTYGLYIWINITYNNTIIRNIISNTTCNALIIEESTGNKIYENQFENNSIGITIYNQKSSNTNMIYHNNFINNSEPFYDESNQTWDNGYSSGGNYWDDYQGEDLYSGINQNETGPDGIGDTPYISIGNLTLDNYPLVKPWGQYSPVVEYEYDIDNNTASFNASYSYDRDGSIVSYEWDFGDTNNDSGITTNHSYSEDGGYNVTLTIINNEGINDSVTKHIYIGNDTISPEITNITCDSFTVGFGFNVTINATVNDNLSGVNIVKVNITYPDNTYENYSMTCVAGNVYSYVFSDTWQNGQYNYSIWGIDYVDNTNISSENSFNVSGQLNISVCTIKDTYGDNVTINLTDPPVNPLVSEIGYELLDDREVLHIWNRFDSYYFNTCNGIQLTNHYNQYWSHNVLMLGYYNNDIWNLIYRTDELSGFNKNIISDNETYINITLWKDLTYSGYNFRLAIRYFLGVDDNELTVILYIKNIDNQDIPYDLGFAWEVKNIQINMTTTGDYIEIGNNSYYLNQTLNETYKNLGNNSCFYIREDTSINESKSLYLRWDENLNYKLQVKSREGQYNAPVTLGIKIGTLSVGQEKMTSLFWHDASEAVYYFCDFYEYEAWSENPEYMVEDSIENFAFTSCSGEVEQLIRNSCGEEDLGTISKVEIRVHGYYEYDQRDIILRPVFSGSYDGANYSYETTEEPGWSEWFDITDDDGRTSGEPKGWSWSEVNELFCDVECENNSGEFIVYCSKVEIRVTYNNVPLISNPYPQHGSMDVGLNPFLNITVVDPEGDVMNITWLSNSSGCWVSFGTNNSVGNGTYHQVFSNASVNGQWWYWKVKAEDDTSCVYSSVYKFYTGVESKIDNTGSTNISGYLLMQVQYFNSSSQSWVVDDTIIEDISPRTINIGEKFGLDTVFNDLVNTWNLSYGNGTYRVYAALCDPSGYVLRCDDDSYVNASYEFQVSMGSDSDGDGLSDFLEITRYYTQPQLADSDSDGYNDNIDIDPLTDLEVSLTVKRIYASEYTYTWREGESWDDSITNSSDSGDGTEWITISDIDASGGYYSRQNDSKNGTEDFARWNFTASAPGVYHIWMRSHRYEEASSNVTLWWINSTGVSTRIYNRGSDHSYLGTEVMWYQNTTNEWKWSWYGIVDIAETGDYSLLLNNSQAFPGINHRDDLGYSHGNPEWWMEVDNILITDDPNCIPSGKGIENSYDTIIGQNCFEPWDNGEGPGGSGPDFYVKATIAGETDQMDYNDFIDTSDILTDWIYTVNVPDNVENVPICIELWEEDGASDTLCDINGSIGGKKCNITYNLRNGTWWGDDGLGDIDFIGRTSGEVDGELNCDANVIFNVAQNDNDGDGITYWREVNVFDSDEPFTPTNRNDRFAVIIGGGASCKLKQTCDAGTDQNPWDGPYLLYDEGLSWTDYSFMVDLTTRMDLDKDIKENIGAMFRYQDENNFYILRWKINGMFSRLYLDKVVNGVRYNICKKFDPFIRNTSYSLNITVIDNNIKIIRTINPGILNPTSYCRTVFDVSDSSHSSGSVALFCWKNEQAWFDDVKVVNSTGHELLVEMFDYGIIPCSVWSEKNGGTWEVTKWSTDQEEMYKGLDFLYRLLLNVFHYSDEDIYYLSSHRWRDADGDSNFDVDRISVRSNIKYALNNWLKGSSDSSDLNFVYMITHGFFNQGNLPFLDFSTSAFDNNRDGNCINDGNLNPLLILKSNDVNSWLNHGYGDDIGRLVFLVDSCMSGHYIDALGDCNEDRIVMASSSIKEPAELETGQDWGAFGYRFFNKLSDGETNIADAFNDADYHVNNTNYMSTYVIKEWDYIFWPQDSRLDDNGNGKGSNYYLPSNGDWYDACDRVIYPNCSMTLPIKIKNSPNYLKITKARVRFNARLGEDLQNIDAELYELYFHDKDKNSWISPSGYFDRWNLWDDEENAYDKDTGSKASCSRDIVDNYPYGAPFKKWFRTSYLVLEFDEPFNCDKIKFKAKYDSNHCQRIDIDFYYDGYLEGELSGKTGL